MGKQNCKTCNKTYGSKTALKFHQKQKHPIIIKRQKDSMMVCDLVLNEEEEQNLYIPVPDSDEDMFADYCWFNF